MSVRIVRCRKLEEADFVRLQEIERQADERFAALDHALDTLGKTLSREELERSSRDGLLWVALEGECAVAGPSAQRLVNPDRQADNWIGFCSAQSAGDGSDAARTGAILYLRQVSVLPAQGGRGIGAGLVDAVMEECRRRGASSVWLRTFRQVPWNEPWYRRQGFTPVADDSGSSGSGISIGIPTVLSLDAQRERAQGLDPQLRVTMARFIAPPRDRHGTSGSQSARGSRQVPSR